MKKALVLLLVALLSFSAFAGGSSEAAPEADTGKKVLTVAKTSQLVGLDQHAVSDGMSLEVIATLFDGLYTLDADGALVPAMAESYEVSDDGLTYIFHLRDAKWSNGTPVTAADFEYSWKRNVDPETASNYNYEAVTAGIKNAEAIINGEMDPDTLGVTAIDEHTLKVELQQVCPFFTAMLIRCSFMPLNQEFVEAQGDNYAKTPDSIISNGPFVLESWDYANNVTVVKNDLYWNAENIDIDELNFVTVADQQTAAMMYSSGDVDFAEISGALIDQYESDPGFSKVLEVHVAYLMANNSVPALQNNNFRKALALSYNKEDIADKVMKNGAMAANYLVGWKCGIGPDGKDFRETSPEFLNYNPELAREYWEKAKAELGVDSVTLELTHYDDDVSVAVSEFIAASVEQNLPGVTIVLDTQPKKNAIAKGEAGDFELFLFRWGPDYADPLAFLELLRTGNTNNWSGYSNPEYDEIIDRTKTGDLAADAEGRWTELKRAEKMLLEEDTAVMPVYQNGLGALINPDVTNLDVRNIGTTYNYRIVTIND